MVNSHSFMLFILSLRVASRIIPHCSSCGTTSHTRGIDSSHTHMTGPRPQHIREHVDALRTHATLGGKTRQRSVTSECTAKWMSSIQIHATVSFLMSITLINPNLKETYCASLTLFPFPSAFRISPQRPEAPLSHRKHSSVFFPFIP